MVVHGVDLGKSEPGPSGAVSDGGAGVRAHAQSVISRAAARTRNEPRIASIEWMPQHDRLLAVRARRDDVDGHARQRLQALEIGARIFRQSVI